MAPGSADALRWRSSAYDDRATAPARCGIAARRSRSTQDDDAAARVLKAMEGR